MARRLADGSIELADGRVIYANSLILGADLVEIIPLFTPPPTWPFVSGGGGGGGTGPQGPAGPAGSGGGGGVGTQGAQGFQGTNPGPQGNQGNQGVGGGGPGPQGNQGFQGAIGAGVQGSQGFQGSGGDGVQGAQGFQGDFGPQGFQGTNPGPQGVQGPSGAGGGEFTTTGTNVHLVVPTNEVTVGPAGTIGKLGVVADDAGQVTLALRLAAGQGADTLQTQDSLGAIRQRITAVGNYDIFATAGDSNPTTSLRSGDLMFGPGGALALDTRLTRVGANQLTVTDASTTIGGSFVPRADGEGSIGTNLLRWGLITGLIHNVYALAGDANPTISMQAGALWFGPGGGGGLDTRLHRVAGSQLTVTDGSGTIGGSFVPRADGEGSIGTNLLRWGLITGLIHNVYALAGDANPTISMQAGALFLGPGGGGGLDTRLHRVAGSQLTVTDGSGTVTGQFVPLTDTGGAIGTSLLRWGSMSSLSYDVFAGAGDANPTIAVRAGALWFGPGGGLGLDTRLHRVAPSQLTVTDASGTVGGSFVPRADTEGSVGTSALRWGFMSSLAYHVFAAASDANPTVSLQNLALFFGPGGGLALDTRLARVGANQLTVTDASTTVGGSFVPRADNEGSVGTNLLRWASMSAIQYNVFGTVGDTNPTTRLQSGSLFFGAGGALALDVQLVRNVADRLDLASGDRLRITDTEIELGERVGDPTSIANVGLLYVKDVAGVTQLFFRRDDTTVQQIT